MFSFVGCHVCSLGCTIIEMSSGCLPWTLNQDSCPKSGGPLMLHIANSNQAPHIPQWLPPECIELIELCLQRKPSKRPSAQELISNRFFELQSFGMFYFKSIAISRSFILIVVVGHAQN